MRGERDDFEHSACKLATLNNTPINDLQENGPILESKEFPHGPVSMSCGKGRPHGIKSEEVRIMQRMFGREVSPEDCVTALDVVEWNAHHAIKVVRLYNLVKFMIEAPIDWTVCKQALETWCWDVGRATIWVLTEIQSRDGTS